MSLDAIDAIEDAFSATKSFLLPFDAGRWLRLAVVAFFVGGAGGSGGGGGGGGGDGVNVDLPTAGGLPDLVLSDPAIAAVLGVAALLLLLGLAYSLVGAVMEFVLVESLRREAVQLRRYWSEHWRAGLRLFGFRLVVGLVGVAAVLVPLGAAFLAAGGPGAIDSPVRLLPVALVALPFVFVSALATALVLGLTTAFVVPVMLLEGTTVLGGWRRFWPTLRAEWREYAVFVLVAFVLRLVVGAVFAIAFGVVAAVVLVPFAVLGVGVLVLGGGQLGLVTLALLGGLGLAALAVILTVSAVLGVPVVTYFRYYALLVLGDTEPAFDAIAERRAAIRGD